jgi:hypothetical protein
MRYELPCKRAHFHNGEDCIMSWTIAPVGRGSNLIYSQAGMPSLDLRFAETKSLNDFISSTNLITFTRASNATFVDSNGLIQTATTNTPRFDHNPATGESLGLLVEEQRVNLLLNSETLATQSATVAAAAHTLSFYGTGSVVLSGAHSATVNGAGAYPTRTTLTFTPTAGSLTLTVTGTVQYANLEAGAFATSWIPTTGSTATRSADVASITGANFSRWYRQDEGTVYSDHVCNAVPTINFVGIIGTNNQNYVDIARYQTVLRAFLLVGNVQQSVLNTVLTTGSRHKTAHSVQVNNVAFVADGLAPLLTTSVLMPSVNQMVIGNDFSTRHLNGRIRRLTYWPTRLSNTTLQTITQL